MCNSNSQHSNVCLAMRKPTNNDDDDDGNSDDDDDDDDGFHDECGDASIFFYCASEHLVHPLSYAFQFLAKL